MDLLPNLPKITRTKMLKYKWIIKDVANCLSKGGAKSPEFPIDAKEISISGAQWYIEMKVDDKRYILLKLYGFPKSSVPLCASCTLAILTKDGNNVLKEFSYRFDLSTDPKWYYIAYYKIELAEKFQEKAFVNNQLTVLCTIFIDDERKVDPTCFEGYKIPQCNLWQSFETLLTTGENADVTLVAGHQNIKAHKIILMARSPVFKAMFKCQMTESVNNLVKIDDIDFVALKELLRFVYTGKAPNLSEMADRLLIAAGKYDFPILLAMCEKEIGDSLTVENAAHSLVMADLHGAKQLMEHTLYFITTHATQVFDTKGWQEIVPKYPCVLDAVCRKFASLQQEK